MFRPCRSLHALAAFAILFTSPAALADGRTSFQVDIAMDGNTFFDFVENPDPAKAGVPPNGSPFIITGYIYPKGTFAAHGANSGVLADGSPEFPHLVIGVWRCSGFHTQDGDALTGVIVVTNQIFDFNPDRPGSKTLVTEGIELADFDVWFDRAIVGGTGPYKKARGHMSQIYVGSNISFGFNTTFKVRVRR